MKDANKLIEDFMLLANRKVPEFVGKKKDNQAVKPVVYRVHDTPNPEKLETSPSSFERLGYKMSLSSKKSLADSFNKLFSDIKGTGTETMIETIAIRTMSEGCYSTQHRTVYGLAFQFYSHFDFAIRRYPDLMAAPAASSRYMNKWCFRYQKVYEPMLRSTASERAGRKGR